MFKEKYKSAFIIRTPYHYINALEAARSYNVDLKRSILIVWSNHFKKRFESILEKEKWGSIKYLPVIHHSNKKTWFGRIENVTKDLKYLLKSSVKLSKIKGVERCFSIVPLEKYVQHITNKLKTKKLIIIDEGVGVFSLTKKYLKKRESSTKVKTYGYDRRRSEPYEFFTSYPLRKHIDEIDKERIKKHSFELSKSKNNVGNKPPKGGIILGSERNEKTKNIYEEFIRESINFMKSSVKNIWYKPHRMETKRQTKKIIKNINVRLIDNECPIEIALAKKRINPKRLTGFASTAIHSILKIYDNDEVRVKVFGRDNSKDRNSISYKYYESMSDQKIDVVYL